LKLKRILAVILCTAMLFTAIPSLGITANAATDSSIYIKDGFDGSVFEFGTKNIVIPFTIYKGSYTFLTEYHVEVRGEDNDVKWLQKSDYISDLPSRITDLSLNADISTYEPGTYYVYYWTDDNNTHQYDTYVDFTIKEPDNLVFRNAQKGVQKGALNNLTTPQSAWIATSANANQYSFYNEKPYQIRLEEIYTGNYADAIASCEYSDCAKPSGEQHWIIMKFWLKNTGNEELKATDIIDPEESFYTTKGATLALKDDITFFYGKRSNQGPYDIKLYPGAEGYFWIGILPREEISFPYIRINNGWREEGYNDYKDYTWLDTSVQTMKKVNGIWYYYKNGKRSYDTTLVKYNNTWYYVKNGIKNSTNTLCKYNGKFYHVNSGKMVKDTTLVKYNNKWYYVKNGVVTKVTTLVKYKGVWYYVKNGVMDKSNTLCKYSGKYYHVKNGKMIKDTTLVKYNNKWYHIKNGIKTNSTTLVKYKGVWYYVKNGVMNKSNTLCKYNGKYYHVKNGKMVKDTTIVKYGGKRYYVKNGVVTKVTGRVKISGKYYKVKNGVVL